MYLREITPDESEYVFRMGYKEWAKGRTFEQYVMENQKEDDYGTRYVYVDQENKIIGSLIVLSLQKPRFDYPLPFYGLGSIVIHQGDRGMGYGKGMMQACLSHIEKLDKNPIILLYSDINPSYYRSFGFQELPENLQRYPKSMAMVRCPVDVYETISKWPITQVPTYF